LKELFVVIKDKGEAGDGRAQGRRKFCEFLGFNDLKISEESEDPIIWAEEDPYKEIKVPFENFIEKSPIYKLDSKGNVVLK